MSALPDRFWAKVDITDECWIWTSRIRGGYGRYRVTEREERAAHRVAYEALVGPIPEGMTLDHLCHSSDPSCIGGDACPHRRCVNPDHLEPVTLRDNLLRSNSFVAINAAKTHCAHGHPFAGDNLLIVQNGKRTQRACRTCRQIRDLARYHAGKKRRSA